MEGSTFNAKTGFRLGAMALFGAFCLPADALTQAPSHPKVVPDWQKKRYDTQSGLPHNTVTALGQDALGYLWIGTVDGLVRFDGTLMMPTKIDTAWNSPFIKAIHGTSDGSVWIGTEGGLHLVDAERLREIPLDIVPPIQTSVQSLFEAANGEVFASSADGVYRCTPQRICRLEQMLEDGAPFDDDYIYAFSEDAGGTGLGLTVAGRILVEDETTGTWQARVKRSGEHAKYLIGTGGSVALVRSHALLAQLNPTESEEPTRPEPARFTSMLRVFDNRLVSIDTLGRLTHFYLDEDTTSTLRNYVRSHFCTPKQCWFGSLNGLYAVRVAPSPFRDPQNELAAYFPRGRPPAVAAVTESQGTVFIGTLGSGLWRIRGEVAERVPPVENRSAPVIWSLAADRRGRLWIGADDGLFVLEPGQNRYRSIPNPSPDPLIVNTLAIVDDSTLAVGSFDGLLLWNSRRNAWNRVPSPPSGGLAIQSIFRMREGSWRLGTFHATVLEWAGPGTAPKPASAIRGSAARSSEGFWDLHEDAFGTLWAASDAGLTGFLGDGGTVQYRSEHGLPGNIAYAIEADPLGRLWVSTDRGLCMFTPDSVYSSAPIFRRFGSDDGLPMLEFNRRASAWIDGRLWFGGVDGWMSFDPATVEAEVTRVPVYVQRVELRGVDGTSVIEGGTLDAIDLPPGTRGLALDFGAVSLSGSSGIKYKYRMEGADYDTIFTGSVRQASYANLTPGSYLFQVWASNSDGIWDAQPATVRVTVLPTFWETGLFRFLVVAVVALVVWAVYTLRVRRLLAVERMRLRIAADLHDQVGSGLSSLAMMSEMAGRNPHTAPSVWPTIAESARGMAKELRDIVWYINPKFDRLDHLVERMKDLPYQITPDVTLRMHFPESVPGTPLSPDFRRDWMLAYRELLHNVAKHARAQTLTIRLDIAQKRMSLTLQDDGTGFDPARDVSGMGLQNVRDRIARLHGTVEWTSSPEIGTMVEINVPMP